MKQLDLWQAEVDALPWGGRSPRSLTRGARALFLRREPEKDARKLVTAIQIDFFTAPIKGPLYEGAPLLIPLLQEEDDAR